MRRPPVVLGLAFITVLALCVALGLILFSVNPGVSDNAKDIRKAQDSQHAIVCAQVQVIANSYRFRSLTPSGEVEPIRHFLTRMQAQRQTLRLARGSNCKSAPGFPPVGLQVRRALRQIHEILQHFEPRLREPVSTQPRTANKDSARSGRHMSFSPAFQKPPKAGVDESGVPAKLHDELAPGEPLEPQGGHPRESQAPEPYVPAEIPEVPKGWVEEDDNPRQAQTEVVVNPPELPVGIEISEEGINVNLEGLME